MEFTKTNLTPIPLPTEIPEPPDLSQLPTEIVHSASIEMLIQQNEDLSARLKVNIRRNSIHEQKIIKLEKEHNEVKRINESLKAQREIIAEKEKIWLDQKSSFVKKADTTLREQKLLDLRYNELYATSQFRQKELQDKILNLQKQISVEGQQYQEHKQRLTREFQSTIKKLKGQIQRNFKIKEKGKDKIRQFLIESAITFQNNELATQQAYGQKNQLHKKLGSLIKELQNRESELKEKIYQLAENSQTQITKLQSRLDEKHTEIRYLKKQILEDKESFKIQLHKEVEFEKSKKTSLLLEHEKLKTRLDQERLAEQQVTKISDDYAALQNEKITAERTLEEEKSKLLQDLTQTRQDNRSLRTNIATLSTQMYEKEKVLKRVEDNSLKLNNENRALESELEKVKELWLDLQEKYEKEKIKSESLAKLNQRIHTHIHKDQIKSHIDASLGSKNPSEEGKLRTKEKNHNSPPTTLPNYYEEILGSEFKKINKNPPPL